LTDLVGDKPIDSSTSEDDYPAERRAWYVVGVLTLAYIFSFIDRQILNLLVGPIKRDLGISDTRMSLLMGLSFAVFYTFFGIPLGRLTDSKSRRAIIIVGITFWSLATAGCGLARRFWHLAVMRMGVGVGEASLSPAAYSMIADYFRPEKRALAMSVYSMGIYVGAGLASVLGGLVMKFIAGQESVPAPVVGVVRPWQLVFFVVGLPGLLVALLLFTVREPTRRGAVRVKDELSPNHAPLGDVLRYIRDNRRTFYCHNLGIALISFASYAATSWNPTLLIRRFHWSAADAGLALGVIIMVFGTLGIVLGGHIADRLARRGQADATLRVALMGAVAWLPFGLLYPLMPSGEWTVALLAPATICWSLPFGVAPAAIQQMMPNAMRGQATAIYLFVVNLIGLGLGPTAIALATDHVFHDENALHLSLLFLGLLAHMLAIALLWSGLAPYRQTLSYLANWSRER
jgi:MFS family permease